VMHSFMLQFVAKCQLLIDDLLFCSVVLWLHSNAFIYTCILQICWHHGPFDSCSQ
jgi:hypothetical protein